MKKLLALCTVELYGFKCIQANLLMFILLHLLSSLRFIFLLFLRASFHIK